MTKSVDNSVLDAALNVIKNNCTRQVACSAWPANFTEANSTYALADVTMASGDFSVANGDVSGRKLVTGAKSGVLIDTSGTATHVAQLDVSNSLVLAVTECTPLALTANGSNTVNFPAWNREIAAPV